MNISMWISAARPKTLIASIAPVCMGSSLAYSAGMWSLSTFLLTLLTAIGIQVSANFSNDYFDFIKGADTAERKGPVRALQQGVVSLPLMKRAIASVLCATALAGLCLVWNEGAVMILLLAVSLLLSLSYTGGPFPLAYLGLGEVFVFLFFGPIAVAGTVWLQTHTLTPAIFLAGIPAGALSAMILVLNHLRDLEEDRKASKNTLAVRWGARFARIEYCVMAALGAIAAFFTDPLASLIFLFAIPLIRATFTCQDARAFHPLFEKTVMLLLAYSFLASLTPCL
jgi:1,4-dihydroxy-2-naphthoate octaprenyltransferase